MQQLAPVVSGPSTSLTTLALGRRLIKRRCVIATDLNRGGPSGPSRKGMLSLGEGLGKA
jgi:hypothetical protein